MRRAALGRVAPLGCLYDASTDNFLLGSVPPNAFTEEDIETMEEEDCSIHISPLKSFEDVMTQLDIDKNLALSMQCGLVENAEAVPFQEKKIETQQREESVILSGGVHTYSKELSTSGLKKLAQHEQFCKETQNATHIVVQIDYGAQVFKEYSVDKKMKERFDESSETVRVPFDVIADDHKANDESSPCCEGVPLKDPCKKADNCSSSTGYSQENHAVGNFSSSDCETAKQVFEAVSEDFPVQTESCSPGGDKDYVFVAIPGDDSVGTACDHGQETFEDTSLTANETAQDCHQITPRMINMDDSVNDMAGEIRKKYTTSSGLPIVYDLKPLHRMSCFKGNKRISCELSKRLVLVDSEPVRRANELRSDLKLLQDVQNLLDSDEHQFPNDFLLNIFNGGRVRPYLNKLTKELRMFLLQLRRGTTNPAKANLHEWMEKALIFSEKKSLCLDLLQKHKKISEWTQKGFQVLASLDNAILKNTFILFTGTLQFDDSNAKLMTDLKTIHSDTHFYVYLVKGTSRSTIHHYFDDECISGNVLAEIESEQKHCLVHLLSDKIWTPSEKMAMVSIRMPNSLTSNNEPVTWICCECFSKVEYGLDTDLLYCQCGEAPLDGVSFVRQMYCNYDMDIRKALKELKPVDEKNLLILGETGVGKSTWINGIFNYLTYESLEEAAHSMVLAPIPASFKIGSKEIKIGKQDANEVLHSKGQSVTQNPRMYQVLHNNTRYNFIDTPGIGDTRGIEMDRSNFDNILKYLQTLDKLDAVCILQKPNNARITVWFEFCIIELLRHLHVSIVTNIVFCFTNARSTFYQPGQTLDLLNNLFQQKKIDIEVSQNVNTFCFDNEALKYLACISSESRDENIVAEFAEFAKSWTRSREDTLKLLKCVDSLPTHQLKETISVNFAREIIETLAKPSIECVNAINKNLDQIVEYETKISGSETEIDELNKVLKVKGISFKCKELPKPRTVCNHENCIEFKFGGKDNKEQKKIYKTVCHDNCYMPFVSAETHGSSFLRFCSAFRYIGMACRTCGHDFREHVHISFEVEEVEKEFIDSKVSEDIKSKTTVKEKNQRLMEELRRKKSQYEQEKSEIIKAQANFGSFLKRNALVPYNDVVPRLIDQYIKDEERKWNSERIPSLEKMKEQYLHNIAIIDSASSGEHSSVAVSPEDILALKKKLCQLPHFGKDLEEAFDKIVSIKNQHNSSRRRYDEDIIKLSNHQHTRQKTKEGKWKKIRKGMANTWKSITESGNDVFRNIMDEVTGAYVDGIYPPVSTDTRNVNIHMG